MVSRVREIVKSFPFHPFLYALYPVVFAYAHHITKRNSLNVVFPWIPAIVFCCFAALMMKMFYLFFRDSHKSAILCSVLFVLVFFYPYFFKISKDLSPVIGGKTIPTQYILFLTGAGIFISCTMLVRSIKVDFSHVSGLVNASAILLVLISFFQIGAFRVKSWYLHRISASFSFENYVVTGERKSKIKKPDIFYIILDGHGRADVLEETYKYNSGEFQQFLRKRGFFVASKSISNYLYTPSSLASSLNFSYLNYLSTPLTRRGKRHDQKPIRDLVIHNRLAGILRAYGYKIITVSSHPWFVHKWGDINLPEFRLKAFEIFKMIREEMDYFLPFLSSSEEVCERHRSRVLNSLESLPLLYEAVSSPFFIFAHIFSPHPPFVFNEKGKKVCDRDRNTLTSPLDANLYIESGGKYSQYIQEYSSQVAWIDRKVQSIIEQILSKASVPPIIIIQGDHGPRLFMNFFSGKRSSRFREAFSILNAYYLPGCGNGGLYDYISPVNTFRVVLNHYFGAHYSLLKDVSYYSNWHRIYRFRDVTRFVNQNHANSIKPDGSIGSPANP